MTDCATTGMRFDTPTTLALEAAFDGGLAWLVEADEELGLCESMAGHVPKWRRGRVRHSLVALVRQRVFR